MVHPDSHRISRVLWYSGTSCVAVQFRLPDFHRLWSVIPDWFDYLITNHMLEALQPHMTSHMVWPLPRSLAATRSISNLISLPSGTEMFHFPELALTCLCIQHEVTRVYLVGLPHSEIPGSKLACQLPEAYRRHTASFFAC